MKTNLLLLTFFVLSKITVMVQGYRGNVVYKYYVKYVFNRILSLPVMENRIKRFIDNK